MFFTQRGSSFELATILIKSEAAEFSSAVKVSCVPVKCEKLIRFKKVMKEALELCQSLTKTSTSRAHEPHVLVQKAVFQKKNIVSFHFICITLPCLRQGSHQVIWKLACCHLQCLFCHSEKQASVQTYEPILHLLQKC